MGDTVPADAEVSYLGTLSRTGGGISPSSLYTRTLSSSSWVIGVQGLGGS